MTGSARGNPTRGGHNLISLGGLQAKPSQPIGLA